jgi:hypothetical protein
MVRAWASWKAELRITEVVLAGFFFICRWDGSCAIKYKFLEVSRAAVNEGHALFEVLTN